MYGLAYLVLAVDGIARTDGTTRRRTIEAAGTIVAPVGATNSIGAISSHMAGITAYATDDVGRIVALLGAIILAMSDLTTWEK